MPRLSLMLAAAAAAGLAAAQQVCNNAASLCDRRYDNVTYAGAHDSPFTRNATTGYSVFGDQFYDAIRILDSGPRLLSAQMHLGGDQKLHLCHTSCAFLDAGLVVDWLGRIKTWLDQNPDDVVTVLMVNSDNANATTLAGIWEAAGVGRYSYAPATVTAAQKEWPTLKELIAMDKRLVTFIAGVDPMTTAGANAPYLLDEFTFVFETPYDNVQTADFSCDPDRPSEVKGNTQAALSSGRLPLMNHFLYDRVGSIEFPAVEKINTTNADKGAGSLGAEADNCTSVYGRAPTYYLADFVNIGPAVDTADRLNGVAGAVQGRKPLPNKTLGLVSSSSASASATASAGVPTSVATDVSSADSFILPSSSSTLGVSPSSVPVGVVTTASEMRASASQSQTVHTGGARAQRLGAVAWIWAGVGVALGVVAL